MLLIILNFLKNLDLASGSSVDWTYDTLKIKYSYAVELRDQGQYGKGLLNCKYLFLF